MCIGASRGPLNVFFLLGACAFAGGFALRAVDPVVLPIATHFGVPVSTAALLSTAYAIPYAIAQPVLGAIGDRLGKERLMRTCVAGLALALAAGALAPSFAVLVATRAVAGVFGGGLIPLVLACVGDRVPIERRHVALGRMLFAIISGQMLGSAVSGLVAGALGWVAVLLLAAALAAATAALAWRTLGVAGAGDRRPVAPTSFARSWRTLFANPLTPWVYGAVFAEGALFYGLFPYMGEVLVARGAVAPAAAPAAAGAVLGAFGLGGVAFAAAIGVLLRALGTRRLCIVGTLAAAGSLAGLAGAATWPIAALAMAVTGFAFYMVHSTVQTAATELAPAARATALAFFSGSFFSGQGLGPLAVGASLHRVGATPTLAALSVLALGLGAVVVLRIAHAATTPPATRSSTER